MTEARPWNESNPEWWQMQVESRGEMAWQWLVNEWADRPAAAPAEGLREAQDLIRELLTISEMRGASGPLIDEARAFLALGNLIEAADPQHWQPDERLVLHSDDDDCQPPHVHRHHWVDVLYPGDNVWFYCTGCEERRIKPRALGDDQ